MNTTIRSGIAVALGALVILTSACSDARLTGVDESPMAQAMLSVQPTETGDAGAQADGQACWGQATRVFAQMGDMGEHSSSYPTPRLGLRNLARLLYDLGILEEDTMQALGAWVAAQLGLSIDACL
jgi:hypothetical protein